MQEDLDFFFGPAPTKPAANSTPSKPAPAANTNSGGGAAGDDFFGMMASQQPQKSPQKSPAPAQPSAFDNDDFFDMLGSTTAPKKVEAVKPPTEAMSKVAVSKPAAKKAQQQQESESESESEEDQKDVVKQQKSGIDSDDEETAKPRGGGGGGGGKRPCAMAECSQPALSSGKFCQSHQGGDNKEDGRKTKGEWSIERKRTGTKLGFIKNITIWKFYFKGEQHCVELYHSTFSGKRVIIVDKKTLVSEKRLIGGDASHKVFAGSDFNTRCEVTVVIKSNNDRYEYAIYIEGLPIRDAKKKYAEYL